MKYLIYAIIIVLLFLYVPVIPYDNQLPNGAVVVEHKPIATWVLDKAKEK